MRRLKEELGPITTPERRVAIVFVLMAIAWVTRPMLITIPGLSGLDFGNGGPGRTHGRGARRIGTRFVGLEN